MSRTKRRSLLAKISIVLLVLLIIFGSLVFVVRRAYDSNLQPVSTLETQKLITVPQGASVQEIAQDLKEAGLIKQTWAFEWYVRSHELRDNLKAGTYSFSPSQTTPEIASTIAKGEVATDLVTILPGKRLDQIRASLINAGFKPAEVDEALKPENYANHPALVDKPAGASLEGYLYPESFQKTAETSPKTIITASLNEMQKRLTPELRAAFEKQGLTVQEGIVLASIIDSEVNRPEDKPIVAQVFLKRVRDGMKLESDVTAFYGSILAGKSPSLTYDSPYNTRIHPGLPPGPIANVTESALKAVTQPASTDYVYFVAGDDGKTYFSHTLAEHEALAQEHCKKLCGR
jgi:UPF0755 protein